MAQPRRQFLVQEAMDSAHTVFDVAKKSGNLKDTCIRLLQNAVENMISVSRELRSLSANREVKALERENKALKDKLARMEGEVETLKKEMVELRATTFRFGSTIPPTIHTKSGPSTPSA